MKSPSTTSSRTEALVGASQSSRAFPMLLARLLIIFLTSHLVLLGVVLLLVG